MTKPIKISDLPTFDMAEHLRTEEDIAAYLTLVINEDISDLFHAINHIARLKGPAGIGPLTLHMLATPTDYEAALRAAALLMESSDPLPESVTGRLILALTDQIQEYERKHFPMD